MFRDYKEAAKYYKEVVLPTTIETMVIKDAKPYTNSSVAINVEPSEQSTKVYNYWEQGLYDLVRTHSQGLIDNVEEFVDKVLDTWTGRQTTEYILGKLERKVNTILYNNVKGNTK